MSNSRKDIPDFTEDFVGSMIQMMLTIVRFPEAPFALIPVSKKDERSLGADAWIDSISPLYFQFKRSFAYREDSTAKFLRERINFGFTNTPRVLYFDLREKQKDQEDYQHNVLLTLRQDLQNSGFGDAFYVAPLFLNRVAYLFAAHSSSIIYANSLHRFLPAPFFEHAFDIVSKNGSIRFQNCPALREHICIPPDSRVSTHKHKYSYLENGGQAYFHSPEEVRNQISLGQFLYNFMNFTNGQPTRQMINFSQSIGILNGLNQGIFGDQEDRQSNNTPSFLIDRWFNFGEKLKMIYDIDQYLLIRFKTTL